MVKVPHEIFLQQYGLPNKNFGKTSRTWPPFSWFFNPCFIYDTESIHLLSLQNKFKFSLFQEYGEVVCVMGSAAQFQNVPIFLQADASLAIEPLYPQLCQSIPVFVPTTPSHESRVETPNVSVSPSWPSPVAVSQVFFFFFFHSE